jgi:L-fuculose-phosphate aldolase
MESREEPQLALRRDVVETARRMAGLGLGRGTSGNVSVRHADGFLVTPSGVPYDACTAEQVVALSLEGRVVGGGRPSSEWRFHRDIYRERLEAGAIVHTHSPFATALACLGRGIPAFHYMVAVAGGNAIRCADYATFGSQELSDHALAALAGHRACLLDRHGVIAFGDSLTAALALAVEVENLAEMYLHVLQVGEPRLLDEAEMERVVEKFRGYGPQSPEAEHGA